MSRAKRLRVRLVGPASILVATGVTALLASVGSSEAVAQSGSSGAGTGAASGASTSTPPKKKKKKPKPAPGVSAAPATSAGTPDPPPDPPPPPPTPEPSAEPASPPTAEPSPDDKKDDTSDKKEEKASSSSNISARIGSEIGGYTDTERVSVLTPSISGSVYNPTSGWTISGSYLVDVVSAASADIVSTASPRYEEVRQAGGLSAEYKPGELGGNVYGSVSREPDYLSYTVGGAVTYDIFEKNAGLLAGYTYGHDIAGRNSTPFDVFSRNIDTNSFKAGLTYILNRRALLTFIGDAIFQVGDTSKPYRYVPMFAPGVVAEPGLSIEHVNDLRLPQRVLELLPGSRNRYAFTVGFANRFDTATLRVEERLYTDNWGLKATTTDLRFLVDVGKRVTVGPHVRLHSQTPVNFWQRAYTSTGVTDIPSLRTGDRELGPETSVSGGSYLRVYVGGAGDPRKVALGLDTYVTYTSYPDDLYIKSRLAALAALTFEVNF